MHHYFTMQSYPSPVVFNALPLSYAALLAVGLGSLVPGAPALPLAVAACIVACDAGVLLAYLFPHIHRRQQVGLTVLACLAVGSAVVLLFAHKTPPADAHHAFAIAVVSSAFWLLWMGIAAALAGCDARCTRSPYLWAGVVGGAVGWLVCLAAPGVPALVHGAVAMFCAEHIRMACASSLAPRE
jgi:hypothetical protein